MSGEITKTINGGHPVSHGWPSKEWQRFTTNQFAHKSSVASDCLQNYCKDTQYQMNVRS